MRLHLCYEREAHAENLVGIFSTEEEYREYVNGCWNDDLSEEEKQRLSFAYYKYDCLEVSDTLIKKFAEMIRGD